MSRWLLISIVRACADLQTFPKRGRVTLAKQPKPSSLTFTSVHPCHAAGC
jgi:hypothetical protein